jgi:mannose-6-phosphate isomerase-like protein (cupin superfamily)
MSVASLAAQARLTPGAISQLESGRIQPSLSTVRSLAEALGVPVFRFFLPDAKDRRVVVRKGDRKRIALPRSKATYELLTPDMRGQLELTEVRLPPGESTGDDLAVHPGEESIVIVRGRAELELDGEVHVLRVGDAATYAAELPHRLTNPTRAEVVAISVITPPWF